MDIKHAHVICLTSQMLWIFFYLKTNKNLTGLVSINRKTSASINAQFPGAH